MKREIQVYLHDIYENLSSEHFINDGEKTYCSLKQERQEKN